MRNLLFATVFLLLSCNNSDSEVQSAGQNLPKYKPVINATATATFAGGCFWCIEAPFEKVPGVADAVSGYTGGTELNPTYQQVSGGTTGHTESVQVHYDPTIVSYEQLVDFFWRQFDPTDEGGSFFDRGSQYRSGIFYHNEEQRLIAEESRRLLEESGRFDKPIATPVLALDTFYVAEDYHQNYYRTNTKRYNSYRGGSGRDKFIDNIWGDEREPEWLTELKHAATKPVSGFVKPSDEELRAKLTDIQYNVTQREGTESPFSNEYYDNKEPGIYVDIVSGEALFSSADKFKSGTGWPSFTRPIKSSNIQTKEDNKLSPTRMEVRSKMADSHLGHIFEDGPAPTGLRYCVNSAALRFIPLKDMEAEGYAEYIPLVTQAKKSE